MTNRLLYNWPSVQREMARRGHCLVKEWMNVPSTLDVTGKFRLQNGNNFVVNRRLHTITPINTMCGELHVLTILDDIIYSAVQASGGCEDAAIETIDLRT